MEKKIKNKQKGKFTKDYRKDNPKKKSPVEEQEFSKVKGCNDPNWYAQNPELLKDVASLPYSNVLGLPLEIINESGDTNLAKYVPGIMSIQMHPSLGCGKVATDAPTVAARLIYSFIRHANSGSANYEAPDLMMYIMAHTSASTFIAELKRVYGVAMHYSARNRYYAETLIQSLGYDPDLIRNNLANFRAFINISAARLNSLKVPKNFVVRERWHQLVSNLYVDSDSFKAQTYLFNFDGYFSFNATSESTGSSLSLVNKPVTGMAFQSMEEIAAYMESLLAPLLGDEDIGIMSGDIIKAYGMENCSEELPIPETHVVIPSDIDEVLGQINNAHVGFGGVPDSWNVSVTQDADGVIVETQEYVFNTDLGQYDESKVLNFKNFVNRSHILLNSYDDVVTPEANMVNTRLIPCATCGDPSGTEYKFRVQSSNTEIPLYCVIWIAPLGQASATGASMAMSPSVVFDVNQAARLSAFDWHPIGYAYNASHGISNIYGDLENFSVVSREVVERMHYTAVLSMFTKNMTR